MSALAAAASDENGDTIATLCAALEQARDWIAEHPDRRPISAGRVVAILTNALAAAPQRQEPVAWAEEIIEFLREHYDTEMIEELDSGDALIRLDDAIAAVEEVAQRYTSPQPVRGPLTDEVQSLIGSMVAELRAHRYCGDCYPENGWPGVNKVLADYAAFKRAHGIGGEA